MSEEKVSVEVSLPPDSSPPPTESTTPSTVLIVAPPSTGGSENVALTEALRRIAELEEQVTQTKTIAESAMTTAIAADISNLPAEDPVVEAMVVPESSDDGPPASEEERPATKKAWWEHWI
jgi:hypothetical protein